MTGESAYAAFARALMRAPEDQQQNVVREHRATLQSVGFRDWLNERARRGKGDLALESLIATLLAALPRQEDPLWIIVSSGVTEAMASMNDMDVPIGLRYKTFLDRWLLATEDEELHLIPRYTDLLTDDVFPTWLRDSHSGIAKLPQAHPARTLHARKVASLAKALVATSSSKPELSAAAQAAIDSLRLLGLDGEAEALMKAPESPSTSRPRATGRDAPGTETQPNRPWWVRLFGG